MQGTADGIENIFGNIHDVTLLTYGVFDLESSVCQAVVCPEAYIHEVTGADLCTGHHITTQLTQLWGVASTTIMDLQEVKVTPETNQIIQNVFQSQFMSNQA